MNSTVELIFLGTAAGKPSTTRNVSSLCLRMDGDVWMFDCGEATQHQLISEQNRFIRVGKISKIFITHMHGDHIYGLPGLLALIGEAAQAASYPQPLDIYGPKGLREYLGVILRLTSTEMGNAYRVHELLFAGEQPTPAHPNEAEGGRAILQREDGSWDVFDEERTSVRAAPIVHRVPCVGYVVQEAPGYAALDMSIIDPLLTANATALREQGIRNPRMLLSRLKGPEAKPITLPDGAVLQPAARDRPGRKVVILGDTSDPYGPLESLATEADVLVHEATNVRIDESVDAGLATKGETDESCRERMRTRGHSTPGMAGEFAKAIGARSLVLNHISPRLLPDDEAVMSIVREEASEAWQGGKAIVARDFMAVSVPKRDTAGAASILDVEGLVQGQERS